VTDGGKDFDERLLGDATGVGAPPPPPSPDLLRAIEGMKPVRTRTRFGAAAVVALVGLIGPVVAVVHGPLRRDLAALPVAWVIAAAALWGAASVLSLTAALVPRRGDVLPAPSRASLLSGAAIAVVALFALFATVDVPGVSMRPADRGWTMFESCLHCIGTIGKVAVVFLVVGLLALRRLVPVGGSRIGMALGAAGGAMGGLLLVFLCPFASTAHVVGGHVVGMVLAAMVGAILMRVTARYAVAIVLLALMAAAGCAGPSATAPPPATAQATAPAVPAGDLVFGPLEGADGDALVGAVKQMDAGQLNKAIPTLEDLHRKHPLSATVLHELALAHRMAHQPRRAVELLLPYRARLEPMMLSALGSALDEAGDAAQAESVLREGIARNPKAGVLYSDLGTTLRGRGRAQDALKVYLQGTEAEPTFPGNYKRAAEIFASSDSPVLALVYGEMFRLLEPARSNKTAEMMVGVYRDGLAGATTTGKPAVADPIAAAIAQALIAAQKQGLSLASLHKVRVALVASIDRPEKPLAKQKTPLLAWLVALNAAGHLEAYDHWLYGPAFPDEMKRWGEAHPKEVEAMTKWAEEHPLFWR